MHRIGEPLRWCIRQIFQNVGEAAQRFSRLKVLNILLDDQLGMALGTDMAARSMVHRSRVHDIVFSFDAQVACVPIDWILMTANMFQTRSMACFARNPKLGHRGFTMPSFSGFPSETGIYTVALVTSFAPTVSMARDVGPPPVAA